MTRKLFLFSKMIKIFENLDQVNFSWFKKETSQKDVPKMSPDKLKGFLLSDFMVLLIKLKDNFFIGIIHD